MAQGQRYDIDITVRDFSPSAGFEVPRLLSRNPDYVFIDVFSGDLEEQKSSTRQQTFLKRFKQKASQKGIGVLPLRSHRYDRQTIKDATPNLGLEGLEDAAVCFFERILQNTVFIKHLMPETKFQILLKPDGHSTFYHVLRNNIRTIDTMGVGRPNDPTFYARVDFPEATSLTEFYCQALYEHYSARESTFLHLELDPTQKKGLETLLSTGIKMIKEIGKSIDDYSCSDYKLRVFEK